MSTEEDARQLLREFRQLLFQIKTTETGPFKLEWVKRTIQRINDVEDSENKLEAEVSRLARNAHVWLTGDPYEPPITDPTLARKVIAAALTAGEGQRNEVVRLKAGKFTPPELQELCHNLSEDDREAFFKGCEEYQRKLFGTAQVDQLKGVTLGRWVSDTAHSSRYWGLYCRQHNVWYLESTGHVMHYPSPAIAQGALDTNKATEHQFSRTPRLTFHNWQVEEFGKQYPRTNLQPGDKICYARS